MIETLESFTKRFLRNPSGEGFLGWFVSADGVSLCTREFMSEEAREQYGASRSVLFLPPGLLFIASEDGTFDLDRTADFFAVAATEIGAKILDAARVVLDLEIKGDNLQDDYMETLDHYWRIDRFCRGEATRAQFHLAVQEQGTAFNEHRMAEKAARVSLMDLLIRFSNGETGAPIATPDLSIPGFDDGTDDSEEDAEK